MYMTRNSEITIPTQMDGTAYLVTVLARTIADAEVIVDRWKNRHRESDAEDPQIVSVVSVAKSKNK